LTDFFSGFNDIELVIAPAMFLLGTILAFVTPLGSILMAAGMLDFYVEMHGHIGELIYKHPVVTYAWGYAIYFGIAASHLGVASLACPLRASLSGAGVSWNTNRKPMIGRILVWSRESSRDEQKEV